MDEIQENLDFLMVCAAEAELTTYGTIRMVKEITEFNPGYKPQSVDYPLGILTDCGGYFMLETYFFEIQNVDYEDDSAEAYEIWKMIADHQESLANIFEKLEREGVGFNPEPPENASSQSMTWFYTADASKGLTDNPQFLAEAITFLKNYRASDDFQDSQRVASLLTFAKHLCAHNWDGASERWFCVNCEAISYLVDEPTNS